MAGMIFFDIYTFQAVRFTDTGDHGERKKFFKLVDISLKNTPIYNEERKTEKNIGIISFNY